MASIDKRVVQMRFDNKSFESNAKATMNTLTKLKAALSNMGSSSKALSGLNKVGNASALDQIAQSVGALEKRFSTLGIVGMRVIQNLTDGLMGGLSKGLDFVTNGIVQGGIKRATNIENAHYQLQALLKDEKKVQDVMTNANNAVDGTAYSFDEAAKAAAMFAASGIKAGDPMENALKGIVGTAAMTNAEFERISLIFTSVAGQGRLMGDQLLQLSSLGLNAPATIADYFNRIDDASTKASDEVREAVKQLSQGKKVTEADIRDLVSDGEIKFKIFAEAMYDAFGESAEKANETFQGAMSNIRSALARIGAGFVSPLIEQNSPVIGLINRVREKINEVKKALVFDEELNNIGAYSKRFTDFVLSMASSLADFVSNLDVASGMEVFYNVVDSVINVLKGLGSILAPIGKAFADVFLAFNVGDVIKATASLKNFTSGLKLSATQSKNLHDVFQGVFSIVKMLASGFISLLSAIFPITGSVSTLGDGVLSLAGAIGRGLTAFANWVTQSKLVAAAFSLIKSASSSVSGAVTNVIGVFKGLIDKVAELRIVEKVISALGQAFSILGQIAAPIIRVIVQGFKMLGEAIVMISTLILGSAWEFLVYMLEKLRDALSNFDVKKFRENVDNMMETLKNLFKLGTGRFGDFISGIKKLGENIKNVFNFDSIVKNLQSFKSIVQEFVGWFKETFGGLFGDLSFGGLIASGGGIALIYSIVEIAKSLQSATKKLDKVPEVLESLSGALKSYTANLKADALKKNAEAILILAGALVVLSFTDTDKALQAATALSVLAGTLMFGTSKLMEAVNVGRPLNQHLNTFAKGLGKAFNQLGKAAKWAAIGGAVKSLGTAVLMVAGSIIAIGLMYKYDKDALKEAETAIAVIATVMVAIMSAMVVLNNKMGDGGSGFLKSAAGVALIAGSLASVVSSLKKVLGIELPNDYQTKIGILSFILAELATIAVVLGVASQKAGSNTIKTTPLIAMTVALKSVISSLISVMKMELPSDYGIKLGIMTEMFIGLGLLILAVGQATKNAGSALKGVGVLLSLALDIAVITGALMLLSLIPAEGMLKGAIGLSAVLLALSTGLYAAGKITEKDTYKTVLSMAVSIGAITASLGVLSMIPIDKMASAGIALGSMLLALALNFKQLSDVDEGTWKPILAMTAAVVTIAGSLYILSQQPWEGMLASGAAMSAVLLSFSYAFKIISNAEDMNVGKAAMFLAMTFAVIPIGYALSELSAQPWQGLLGAAAGLSATILAFTAAYSVVSNSGDMNIGKAATFLAMTLAVIPIGAALSQLALQPWQGLLVAAASLSATILAFSAAYKILSTSTNVNIGKAATFLAMTLAVIPIGAALSQLAGQPWKGLLASAVAVSGTLVAYAAVFKIVGSSSPNIAGIIAFVAGAVALVPIAAALDMIAGQPWQSLLVAAAALGGVILALTVAMAIMGAASTSIVGVLAFVAGAVALIPIAGVIDALSGLSWQEVATGLIALAGGLTIIGVAGLAGVAIAPGLLALSASLIVFAAAIAALGVAIPVFIDGLTALFDALGNAAAIVGEAVSGMVDAGKNLMAGLLEGIASGASAVWEGIKGVGQGIVDGICSLLGIHSPSTIFEAIGLNVDAGFVQGITGGADGITGAMDSVFGGLADKVDISAFTGKGEESASLFGSGLLSGEGDVKSIMGNLADASGIDVSSFMDLGSLGVGNLGQGLSSGEPDIKSIMTGLMDVSGFDISGMYKLGTEGVQGMDKGLKSGDPNVKKTVKQLTNVSGVDVSNYTNLGKKAADAFNKGAQSGAKSGAASAASSIAKTLKSAVDSSVKGLDFTSTGKSIITSIEKGMKSSSDSVKSAAQTIAKNAANAVKTQQDTFKTAGTKSMSGYVNGLKSKSEEATNVVKNVAKNAANAVKTQQDTFKTAGTKSMSGYVNGLKSKSEEATNVVKNVAKKLSETLKSEVKNFQKVGSEMINGLVKGIKSKESDANTAAKNIANKAVKGLESQVKSFQAPGKNSAMMYVTALTSTLDSGLQSLISRMSIKGQQIVQGLANGINANMGVARSAASALARTIDQQIKSDLQIHSPSKVAEKRGSQVAEGLAKGINGGKGKVKEAAKGLTDTIKKELNEAPLKLLNEAPVSSFMNAAPILSALGEAPIKMMNEAPLVKSLEQLKGIGKQIDNAEKIGKQLVEALAKGIKGSTAKVKDAAKVITNIIKSDLTQLKSTVKEWNKEDSDIFGLNQLPDLVKNLQKAFKNGANLDSIDFKNLLSNTDSLDALRDSLAGLNGVTDGKESLGKAINSLLKEQTGRDMYQTAIIQKEQDFWENLLATKQAGSEKEKYIDMEMSEFRESILEDYTSIMDEYNQKVEQERETVRSWYEPFKEVDMDSFKTRDQIADRNYKNALKEAAAEDIKALAEEKAKKTSKSKKKTVERESKVSQVQRENVTSFTKMLEQQGKGYKKYEKTYDSLEKKLKGTQLWDYLKEQGPDALQYMIEIDELSNKGLKKVIKQYDSNLAEADKIAKKRTKEAAKNTKQAIKDLFEVDGSAKDAAAKKYLDSLTLEEQYWTKLLAVKQNGAEAEKYMDMEIQDFRKEMLNSAKDIVGNFNDQSEQIKKSMRDSFGIFDEINTKSNTTAEQVLRNARERANAFMEYKQVMDSLAQKLSDTSLWNDYLSSMTINDLGNLKVINSMTTEQLDELAKSWDRGTKNADIAAQRGLEQLRETTKKGLADLLNVSTEDINLDDFINAFDGTAESIEQVIMKTSGTISSGTEEITEKIEIFIDGISDVFGSAKDLMLDYQAEAEEVKKSMSSMFGLFSEINKEANISAEQILQNAKDRADAFIEYKNVMDDLAQKLSDTSLWNDYLSSMTINDLGNLKAINGMTAEQLGELVASWDRGTENAGLAAERGLESIKEKTRQGLADLLNVPVEEINLDDFINAFDGTAESIAQVILNIGEAVSNGKEEINGKAKELMDGLSDAIGDGLETASETAEESASEIGPAIATNIANGMIETSDTVNQAAQSLAQGANSAMADEENSFQEVGSSEGETYANGVSSKQPEAENAGVAVASSTIDGIKGQNENAEIAGSNLGTNTVNGINSEIENAELAGSNLASSAVNAASSYQSSFYNVGSNLAQGFVSGIQSKIEAARRAAAELAAAAKASTENKLDIHSPSRVMMRIGEFTGLGFVNGIMTCLSKAANASEELGDEVTKGFDTGLSDIVIDDLFVDPVIRPEVDLDGVYQSVDDICKLFNDAIQIAAIDAEAINLNLTTRQRRKTEQSDLQKKQNKEDGDTIYNFTQNNYSPKALSEADIYRQTKNQFTMFRTAVARG